MLIAQCGETKLTMDYNKLEEMISNHLCNISPTLKTANDEVPEPEYLKCMAASKQLPPPMVRKTLKKLSTHYWYVLILQTFYLNFQSTSDIRVKLASTFLNYNFYNIVSFIKL